MWKYYRSIFVFLAGDIYAGSIFSKIINAFYNHSIGFWKHCMNWHYFTASSALTPPTDSSHVPTNRCSPFHPRGWLCVFILSYILKFHLEIHLSSKCFCVSTDYIIIYIIYFVSVQYAFLYFHIHLSITSVKPWMDAPSVSSRIGRIYFSY